MTAKFGGRVYHKLRRAIHLLPIRRPNEAAAADCFACTARLGSAVPTPPTFPRVASSPRVGTTPPTNDTTPARAKRGALGGEPEAVQPLIANSPRSDFLNRDSFPFVLISRRIAE